jgi:hypothetical protein
MNLSLWTAAILALAAGLGIWRCARSAAHGARCWLQLPAAFLLYFLLFPPTLDLRGDSLTVITPGASRAQRSGAPIGQPLVVLGGAAAPPLAETAPDLATALRRHPSTRRLTVIGGGLGAADRAAAAAVALQFEPAAGWGFEEVVAPSMVPLGREWRLAGRASAAPTAAAQRAELRDPSGQVVDTSAVDASGRFALSAPARGLGPVSFELRLLGAQGSPIDAISIPLVIAAGTPLRMIVRYGAVNPELKYLRRWAEDAGIDISASAALSEGVYLRDGDAALGAAALAQADLVIIDSRAWAAMAAAEKAALRAAIDQGLGVLLRVDTPPDPATAADWEDLGYTIAPAQAPGSITLDALTGLHDRTAFSLAPVTLAARRGTVQLAADDGQAIAWWQPRGQGRTGVWRLLDSYRLVLKGEAARYASLWGATIGLLARPRAAPAPPPPLPRNAWVDERVTLCGLGAAATVIGPDEAQPVRLIVGSDGCAAYWPDAAGWHRLETGGMTWPLYVRAADDGRSLRAAIDSRATADLAVTDPDRQHAAPPSAAAPAVPQRPMARWPWLLAWLAVTAALWWFERAVPPAARVT